MSTNSTKCKEYVAIPEEWYHYKDEHGDTRDLQDCCIKGSSGDPKGCDCCYDNWNDELKEKQKKWGELSEESKQAKDNLAFSKSKRDGFKKWKDDLVVMQDNTADICNQFDLIISQVHKMCSSSKQTVKATKILMCMIRDFYMQLDKIRVKYDKLMNCIKDNMNTTILAPGTGFMKCLEAYNEKLDAVLKTKEDVVRQIMDIIRMAGLVHEDACSPFGLACILEEWQCRLKCKPGKEDCGQETPTDDNRPCKELDKNCVIYPDLTFPISSNWYTKWVSQQYDQAIIEVETNSAIELQASKDKEAIESCINSLKEAVAATNPKDRCS